MDIKNVLMLTMVKNIGPAFIKKNRYRLSHVASCEEIVREVKPEEMDNVSHYEMVANEIISDCKANDIKMISILDDTYPSQLAEISDPPSVLFLKGDESLLKHVIAIIGTRHSSELGNRIAERVGTYFSHIYGITTHTLQTGNRQLCQNYENSVICGIEFGPLFDYFKI